MSTWLTVVLGVVVGVGVLMALMRASAKRHTARRADEVWRPIERRYGPQQRVDWLYGWDGTEQVEVALSTEAVFMVVGAGRLLLRLPWERVEDLACDPDLFVLTTTVEGAEQVRCLLTIPGQGATALPLRAAFSANLIRQFKQSRTVRG
ncbi:MAG TPA: hypothetical protein VMV41_05060 [Cellulomonadaceae bacterium]|nr:hypothetical protein [Cellulomonadaceae bacterium]